MDSDYIVYVDESGDHGLESINPTYPVFILVFCIFHKETYIREIVTRLLRLKFEFWGHDTIVLHSNDIRKQKGEFAFLTNRALREALMANLNELIAESPFTLIASVIDKQRHRMQYADPANPYDIAMQFCMERLQLHLRSLGQLDRTTHVIVERRGRKEDNDLELAFRRICARNEYVGPMANLDIQFADKRHNSAGLQLADLVAHPIGRHCIDSTQPNRAYDVVETKLRRSGNGKVEGWGLKVFP